MILTSDIVKSLKLWGVSDREKKPTWLLRRMERISGNTTVTQKPEIIGRQKKIKIIITKHNNQ